MNIDIVVLAGVQQLVTPVSILQKQLLSNVTAVNLTRSIWRVQTSKVCAHSSSIVYIVLHYFSATFTICGVKLNERKKNEGLRELLGLEPVSLMIKKSMLRWFGHVERKDDNDWVKCCITWEVEGIRQRGCQKKTWWDCVKNDMESLGLSQKDAQSRNKW